MLTHLAFESTCGVIVGIAAQASCATPSMTPIIVGNSVPQTASQIIPEAFISFAIEFSHFPDYAGNMSAPNTYSDNLLNNIGNFTGTKPYVRVGGNSQDLTLYNSTLTTAVHSGKTPRSIIHIGKSFFQSYSTWPNTKFSHGFDLAQAVNASGWQSLLDTVPLACAALQGKLVAWEYGNEPDLYTNNTLRGPGWDNAEYVSQWQNGTNQIQRSLAQACPAMASGSAYGYTGLSFWGDHNDLDPATVWNGLKTNGNIKMLSFHNYMASTANPSVTLQNTLLNHTYTVTSVRAHLVGYQSIIASGTPIIVGEANSLFNIGTPGISDTFGAALWTMDYNLWCASQNISRVHMQQGLNFYYDAWQPIDTAAVPKGTKAPYYGSIAAAAMLGNAVTDKVRISNIPIVNSVMDVAYAAYVDGTLTRIAVLNMRGYDANSGVHLNHTYSFEVLGSMSTEVNVRRLLAAGSDSLSGITWDGYSYDFSLDEGKPVLLPNVTRGQTLPVNNGVVTVQVMNSGAVILEFV